MGVLEQIEIAKKNNWKICYYGLGKIGSYGKEIINYFDIEVNYYCDRNRCALESFPADKKYKLTMEQLKLLEDDILLFLFLNNENVNSAIEEFKKLPNLHFITWKELIEDKRVVEIFFGINNLYEYNKDKTKSCILENNQKENKKIAVFTCITNGYDKLNVPVYLEEDCDYYLITDVSEYEKIENDEYYTRINISDIIPQNNMYSPKERNRYCKTHGYNIFKDYDYSIYLDGSLRIVGKISDLINKVGKYGVAFHRFPNGNDVFSHAMSLAIRTRIRKNDAIVEMKKMSEEGFPFRYGMAECGVVVCNHSNRMAQQILNNWYVKYSHSLAKRDQLYLPYVLWKMKIDIDDVCTLPGNLRNNGYFEMVSLHTGFQE